MYKPEPLPAWVVPALRLTFAWGGWLLLVAALATVARKLPRWRAAAGAGLALALLAAVALVDLGAPFLPPALHTAAGWVGGTCEVLFFVIAVTWGTLWYRNSLGGNF